ncbi:MAG: hypothetical protein IJW19_00425 [Clostridia bacterium]|nr:hypothetical protein [Clostridia bacterium]
MENNILGLEEFASEYPDVNVEELLNDESFSDYAEGRLESTPISTVYKKYETLTKRLAVKEREKLTGALANKLSSVGSLSNSNPSEELFFTKEQVMAMSKREISVNYEKIRKSQEKWR